MSTPAALLGNPFAALLDPSAVLAVCRNSQPLSALRSAVHRPLDKPRVFADSAAAEYDAAIDAGLPLPSVVAARSPVVVPAGATAYEAGPSEEGPLVLEGHTRFS